MGVRRYEFSTLTNLMLKFEKVHEMNEFLKLLDLDLILVNMLVVLLNFSDRI